MDTEEARLVRVCFSSAAMHCVGWELDSKMCNVVQVLLTLQALGLDDAQIADALTQTRGRKEALHNVQVSLRVPQQLTCEFCITPDLAGGWCNMQALVVSLGNTVIAHNQVQTQLDETNMAVSFEIYSLCAIFHMLLS